MILFLWIDKNFPKKTKETLNCLKNSVVSWLVMNLATATWQDASTPHHHCPPSFLLCLCICCSLRGRCSYVERQQADSPSIPPSIPHMITPLSDCNNTHHPISATPLLAADLCMSFTDPHLYTIRTDNWRLGAQHLPPEPTNTKHTKAIACVGYRPR